MNIEYRPSCQLKFWIAMIAAGSTVLFIIDAILEIWKAFGCVAIFFSTMMYLNDLITKDWE